MKTRRCKECGKEFTPKGREQYCTDIHYRPCPDCGEPVEAKYLSDPPRRCNNCKGRKKLAGMPKKLPGLSNILSSVSTEKPESNQDESKLLQSVIEVDSEKLGIHPDATLLPGADIRQYIGNGYKNCYVPGHFYSLNIEKTISNYEISSAFDLTTNEPVNLFIVLSSMISVNQYFKPLEGC